MLAGIYIYIETTVYFLCSPSSAPIKASELKDSRWVGRRESRDSLASKHPPIPSETLNAFAFCVRLISSLCLSLTLCLSLSISQWVLIFVFAFHSFGPSAGIEFRTGDFLSLKLGFSGWECMVLMLDHVYDCLLCLVLRNICLVYTHTHKKEIEEIISAKKERLT